MKVKFSASKLPLSVISRIAMLSPVSHVEFVFSDGVTIFPSVELGQVILVKKRFYPYEYVFDLDITEQEEQTLREWAESHIGVKFDYRALSPFNILIPRKKTSWKDPSVWMCSEFVAAGLEIVGYKLYDDKFKKIIPKNLLRKFQNKEVVKSVNNVHN